MIQTSATPNANALKMPAGISAWPDAVLHSSLQKLVYHLNDVMELQWDMHNNPTAFPEPDKHLGKIQQLRLLAYGTIMRLAELGITASQPRVPATPEFLQQTLTISLNLLTAIRQLRTEQIALLEQAAREHGNRDANDDASMARYDLETLDDYLEYLQEELPGFSPVNPALETPRRVEAGYRVAEVYSLQGPIETFPDTAEGRYRAIQLAKSLCRDRHQRGRLYDSDRVDDPDFITTVERFHTHVELLGLFSPQDPDYCRFGHLPDGYDESRIATVLSTKGKWSCLELPEGTSVASDAKEFISRVEHLVQALETAVRTVATRVELNRSDFSLIAEPDYDATFRRIYEVAQHRGKSHSPDDFVRSLITLQEVDAGFAVSIANQLYAAQQQVSEAVADAASALLEQLPEQDHDQALGDLRAFIYEVLLAAVCSKPDTEQGDRPEKSDTARLHGD
jgi:hypothetical protein